MVSIKGTVGPEKQHEVMGNYEGREWKREGGEKKPENSVVALMVKTTWRGMVSSLDR